MRAYYNEIEPYAAQWLRNLIVAGHLAPGDVDERDVRDVKPDDLEGYAQCHFFAGLGGWSYALRLAGWPDDRPVWTGSCPCQPFSMAGKRQGFADERHLWPAWFRLISQRRPATIFGEQVASAVDWLSLVRSDLESLDYAVGTIPVQAASAGAFHLRDRFWFVANGMRTGLEIRPGERSDNESQFPSLERDGGIEWLRCADGKFRPVKPGIRLLARGVPARVGKLRAFGNAIVPQVAAEFIKACFSMGVT